MFKRNKFKNMVADIVEKATDHLEDRDVLNAKDMLDHNEWGIAFDIVCQQIYEHGSAISDDFYNQIEDAGHAMKMEPDNWEFLRELIQK